MAADNPSVRALLVMARKPGRRLAHILETLGFEVAWVNNCRQARHSLHTSPPFQVVITNVTLPDGNWCDLLRCLVETGLWPTVLLSSPVACERLRSEALSRGVHRILIEPYQLGDVRGAVRETAPIGARARCG